MTQYRTHTLGELTRQHQGQDVVLSGWVDVRRDHGGVIFLDLRDRYGVTQVVIDPEKAPEAHTLAQQIKNEYVVQVFGVVHARPESMINKNMPTGEIEVLLNKLVVLSASDVLPFQIEDEVKTSEVNRLTHRYLDLRRNPLQDNLVLRHKLNHSIRNFLNDQSFVEVETPYLTRSTPEGARDYIVPSRVHPGSFFALPQSPQLFKQLLMIANLDRYYQIVRCFRDEDLRADRQPEFTQLDMELSFVDQSYVQSLVESMMKKIFEDVLGVCIPTPFPRMSYQEAMQTYASDKPDLRYPLPLVELSDVFRSSDFQVFANVIATQGEIRAMVIPGGAVLSRSQIDQYTKKVKSYGAKGLIWIKKTSDGTTFSIDKFLSDTEKQNTIETLSLQEDDLALIVADQKSIARSSLTEIKGELLTQLNIKAKSDWSFLWVESFPLFEYDAQEGRYVSIHHPFTQPHPDDKQDLLAKQNLDQIRSNAYDLVLNGYEIGGGSIRIHEPDLQKSVFDVLGISSEAAQEKFGFFLKALSYGTPPHGGIAFGLDRIAMLMAGCDSLRDVIAFPKTQNASDLMVQAPSKIDVEQLLELHLRTAKNEA